MTPLDIREETIFSLWHREDVGRRRADWFWLAGPAAIAWLGATAFLGQYRPNQVARLLYKLAPADTLFAAALAGAFLAAGAAVLTGRRRRAGAAGMVAAFLAGHQLYAWSYTVLPGRFVIPFGESGDGLQFAMARVGYAVMLLLPMLLVWWLMFRGQHAGSPRLALGIGKLDTLARDVSRKAALRPVWRELLGGYGVFCVVLFVLMQANVGFRPLLGGGLWPLLPAVIVASAGNALAEEFIFRGLIQPAFIRSGGVAAGLWVQGLMFGMMHWGVSVGVLAALPVSLLIGLGSVAWGKTTLDTGGLGYVIIAHAMIDVCVMSAFLVR